jgi:aryl-alcohol dehydrogenase
MHATAAVTPGEGQPFVLREVEIDDPRDDEVIVRMVGSGVCHTDLIVRDQWYPTPLPCVLGHEGVGVVEAVGSAVTGLAAGDPAVLTYDFCGLCANCRRGHPTYCVQFFERNFGGARIDGTSPISADGEPVGGRFFGQSSFATHASATERNAIKVRDDAPLELLGPLGCGVQTGAGGVLNVLGAEVGSSIVVFGAGAVGDSAIMAAAASGCSTIVAVDLRANRLALAEQLGATHTVDASDVDDVVVAVKDATGGGADYAIDATGSPKALRQAVESLGHLGVCGLIGAPRLGTTAEIDMNDLMVPGKTLRGIVEGDSVPSVFIPQLIDMHAAGRFPFDRLVRTYPFTEIEQAAHDAEEGKTIKPVLTFG